MAYESTGEEEQKAKKLDLLEATSNEAYMIEFHTTLVALIEDSFSIDPVPVLVQKKLAKQSQRIIKRFKREMENRRRSRDQQSERDLRNNFRNSLSGGNLKGMK